MYVPGNLRGNRLAGTAPFGEGVEDDDRVLSDRLLELFDPAGESCVSGPLIARRGLGRRGNTATPALGGGGCDSRSNVVDGHLGRAGCEASRGSWYGC